MIYFDNNKIAYNTEIDNYICSIEDSLWIQYNTTDKWDIINGKFVDISSTEDYKQKELAKAKEAKHIENLDTANNKQQNSIIEYKGCLFETSDSNRCNLRDTSEGLEKGLVTKIVWLTKDDVQLEVTLEDVVTVRSMILQFVNDLWNTTYLNYKKAIDRCTTKEEVDSIIINYDSEE